MRRNNEERCACANLIVSTEGFTPICCAHFCPHPDQRWLYESPRRVGSSRYQPAREFLRTASSSRIERRQAIETNPIHVSATIEKVRRRNTLPPWHAHQNAVVISPGRGTPPLLSAQIAPRTHSHCVPQKASAPRECQPPRAVRAPRRSTSHPDRRSTLDTVSHQPSSVSRTERRRSRFIAATRRRRRS